jgi:hypothetical protein
MFPGGMPTAQENVGCCRIGENQQQQQNNPIYARQKKQSISLSKFV